MNADKPKTVREAYERACDVIAYNDEPGERSLKLVSEQVSVCVVADAFGLKPETVARKIIRLRNGHRS